MHVTVWRQPSPRTAWTVSHLHAVSDFITHVVYVHVLKRYKREVRIYGDHCTVVVVRLEQRKSAFRKSGFGRKRVSSPTAQWARKLLFLPPRVFLYEDEGAAVTGVSVLALLEKEGAVGTGVSLDPLRYFPR